MVSPADTATMSQLADNVVRDFFWTKLIINNRKSYVPFLVFLKPSRIGLQYIFCFWLFHTRRY